MKFVIYEIIKRHAIFNSLQILRLKKAFPAVQTTSGALQIGISSLSLDKFKSPVVCLPVNARLMDYCTINSKHI